MAKLRLLLGTSPNKRIELGGTFANEPILTNVSSSKDRFGINVVPIEYTEGGRKREYLLRRPGFTSQGVNSVTTQQCEVAYGWEGNQNTWANSWSDGKLFVSTTLVGTAVSSISFLSEGYLGTTPLLYAISQGDNAGYYFPNDAANASTAFTASTISTSAVVSSLATTSSMYAGQAVYGPTISSGTRIFSVDSATQITLTGNPVSTSTAAVNYYDGLAKILDVDFPGNAGKTLVSPMRYKDGYAFCLTQDGLLFNSDNLSITAWGATSYVGTAEYPDQGTGLELYKNLLVAFNAFSMEFFEDTGGTLGSPLSRVPQLATRVGMPNYNETGVRLVVPQHATLYWIGATQGGKTALYRLNGYSPERVSDEAYEVLLEKDNQRTLNIFPVYGRTLAHVESTNSSRPYNLMFDVESKQLGFWVFAHDTSSRIRMAAAIGEGRKNILFCTNANVSSVYFMDPMGTTWLDDGTQNTVILQTTKFDNGNEDKKRMNRLRIVSDLSASTCNFSVQHTDDDYQTFSTTRTIDLSQRYREIHRCGMFERRAWRLTHTGNVGFRIEALEGWFDQLP